MRVVLVRHAQSHNNVLSAIDYAMCHECRNEDPSITEQGERDAIKLGKFLKENDFKIDQFYTSALKRSLETTNIISNVYNSETPKTLFLDIHEFGGVYIENTGLKGLNSEEIKKTCQGITIPTGEEESLKDGWWKSDKKETEEAFKDRVKKVVAKLKDMAHQNEEDYTICLVTHVGFLNGLFNVLINCEFLVESNNIN